MSVAPGSSTSASAVFLEVEAFAWTAEDRIELRGRWSGVRGIRLVRPTVVLHLADGGQKRLLASLEHKPWTAVEGEEWIAAFDWRGLPATAASAQLSVGTGLTFEIPPPTMPGGDPVPAPSREAQADAARRAAHRERDTVNRALESLRGDYQDLESRLQVTLAQRDEARQRRDAMRGQLEDAVGERQQADAERDRAIDERDDAIVSRDAAIADREETLEARNQAVRARQQAEREHGDAATERDDAVGARDTALSERDQAIARADRADKLARTAELERRVAVQAAEDARNAVVPQGADDVEESAAPPLATAENELLADLRAQVAALEENLGKATKARRKALAERDDALQRLQRVMTEPLEPRAGSRAQRFQAQPVSERDTWSAQRTWVIRAIVVVGLLAVIIGMIGVLSVL